MIAEGVIEALRNDKKKTLSEREGKKKESYGELFRG